MCYRYSSESMINFFKFNARWKFHWFLFKALSCVTLYNKRKKAFICHNRREGMRKQLRKPRSLSLLEKLFSLVQNFFLNSHNFCYFFFLRSTSLSNVADSPSVYHFSSHMGQLMRHSADSLGGPIQGCAMLWPHCPYSSDKLMRISTKVRLRWRLLTILFLSLTCF